MSKEAFQEALATAPFIALASSVDDQPNVRLIDTYYDADKNMLLFPTSRKTPKVAEFAKMKKLLLLPFQILQEQLFVYRRPT